MICSAVKSKQSLKLWLIIFVIDLNAGRFLLLTFCRTYTAKPNIMNNYLKSGLLAAALFSMPVAAFAQQHTVYSIKTVTDGDHAFGCLCPPIQD